MSVWKLEPYTKTSKSVSVSGPLCFKIDLDDVDYESVTILAKALVDVLNEGWGENPPLYEALHQARRNVSDLEIEADWDGLEFAVMVGAQNIPYSIGVDPKHYTLREAVECALALQELGGDAAVMHLPTENVVWC